jgi:putative flippase GtrA
MSVSLESIMLAMQDSAKSPPVVAEIVSFLVVGGLAALSFIVLSTLLIGLDSGVPDWIVSALCYALHVGPVYLAHRRFSFRSQAPHAVALPRYIAVQLSALALAAVFSFICYALLDLQATVAAAIVIVLTSGVNFVVLKLWAFAHRG